MSRRNLRFVIIGALTTLLLGLTAALSFAQSAGFSVVSITPNPLNPTAGQLATIRYSVPAVSYFRIYVRNSAGTEIRGLVTYSNMSIGTYSRTWDGKDNQGKIAPNGTYTVVVEGHTMSGTTLPTGTGTVAVTGSGTTGGGTGGTTTGAFKVTGITPNPYDPTKGNATISYSVPTTANYRMYVCNSSGTEIRGLVTYVGVSAGNMTRTWDGKDNLGKIVPNGTYTVTIQGTSNSGAVLTTGTGTVTVGTTTPPPPPPPPTTQAFTISGISPSPFDPSKGVATVTYAVPAVADYSVAVKNSSGTALRTLCTYTAKAAGTYTVTWDGKDSSGAIVPNATYTVAISGTVSGSTTAITTANANVAVSTTVAPPPPPPPPPPPTNSGELGQTVEGAGSANFAWLKYAGDKFDVMFIAPKSGTINKITQQWKSNGGYGGGNFGTFTFELQSNGSNNYPSGTVLARTTGIRPTGDGALSYAMNASLTANQIYHVVITNTDSSPSTNWSSPNTLMSRVLPWDGTVGNRGAVYENGAWKPWTSTDNEFNTAGSNYVNGAHVPLMLSWSDGTNTGDPYYSAAISGGAKFYGSNKAGEYIVWNNPTVTISKVGVSVGKSGSPGALIYHLEKVGSGDLATGTIATAAQIGSIPTWVYATLSSPVTLQQGQTYRLWCESPSSSSSSYYYQYIPYGENNPSTWIAAGWGGSQSCYTTSSGSSWSTTPNFDFVFSLR